MIGPTSELLLFRLGARTYAAAVGDVRRIGATRDGGEHLDGSLLGAARGGAHGLVVAGAAGDVEQTLVVDSVLGVRSVPAESVHPLPAFAAACLQSGAVAGYVFLDEEAPTLLVDLRTLVREHLAHQPERQ